MATQRAFLYGLVRATTIAAELMFGKLRRQRIGVERDVDNHQALCL